MTGYVQYRDGLNGHCYLLNNGNGFIWILFPFKIIKTKKDDIKWGIIKLEKWTFQMDQE